jgi:hypothetical protein
MSSVPPLGFVIHNKYNSRLLFLQKQAISQRAAMMALTPFICTEDIYLHRRHLSAQKTFSSKLSVM